MPDASREIGVEWRLRTVMAERGLWKTTELVPLLRDRGVELSPSQIYRLATRAPERLSLHVLAAMCDALECTPGDLIVVHRGDREPDRS